MVHRPSVYSAVPGRDLRRNGLPDGPHLPHHDLRQNHPLLHTRARPLSLHRVGSRDARRDPLPRGPLAAPGGPGLRDHSSQPRGPLFGALRALHGRHGHDPCSRRVIEVDPRGRLRAPALTPARPTPAAAHSWRAVEPLHPPLQHDHRALCHRVRPAARHRSCALRDLREVRRASWRGRSRPDRSWRLLLH